MPCSANLPVETSGLQTHFSPGFWEFEPRFSHKLGKCFYLPGYFLNPVAFSFPSLILASPGDCAAGLSVLGSPVSVCIYKNEPAANRTVYPQCRNRELPTNQRGRWPRMCLCPGSTVLLGPGQTAKPGQRLLLTHALFHRVLQEASSRYQPFQAPGNKDGQGRKALSSESFHYGCRVWEPDISVAETNTGGKQFQGGRASFDSGVQRFTSRQPESRKGDGRGGGVGSSLCFYFRVFFLTSPPPFLFACFESGLHCVVFQRSICTPLLRSKMYAITPGPHPLSREIGWLGLCAVSPKKSRAIHLSMRRRSRPEPQALGLSEQVTCPPHPHPV